MYQQVRFSGPHGHKQLLLGLHTSCPQQKKGNRADAQLHCNEPLEGAASRCTSTPLTAGLALRQCRTSQRLQQPQISKVESRTQQVNTTPIP
jgi:hypothetical protein